MCAGGKGTGAAALGRPAAARAPLQRAAPQLASTSEAGVHVPLRCLPAARRRRAAAATLRMESACSSDTSLKSTSCSASVPTGRAASPAGGRKRRGLGGASGLWAPTGAPARGPPRRPTGWISGIRAIRGLGRALQARSSPFAAIWAVPGRLPPLGWDSGTGAAAPRCSDGAGSDRPARAAGQGQGLGQRCFGPRPASRSRVLPKPAAATRECDQRQGCAVKAHLASSLRIRAHKCE